MVSSGSLSESPELPVWQPLTFGGVASFARARWGRLLLLQTIVAAFVVAAGVVFLSRCWFPVMTQATQDLTAYGAVRGGQLAWPKTEAVVLAENRFLSLVVDLADSGATGQVADLQVEFTRDRIKFASLLGYTELPYPVGWAIELNRQTLDPWWNAWRPAFLFGGIVATLVFLFVSWFVLATLYALPVWVLAWIARRSASLAQCWRVAAAALLPGAIWLGGAILLYVGEQLSLVGLGAAFGLHFLIAWIYLLGAPFHLPTKSRAISATEKNPFTPASPAPPGQAPAAARSGNPFHPPPPSANNG